MAKLSIRVSQADVAETFVDEAIDCINEILKLDPDRETLRLFSKLQNYLDEAEFILEDKLEESLYHNAIDSDDDCEGSGNPANRFGAED